MLIINNSDEKGDTDYEKNDFTDAAALSINSLRAGDRTVKKQQTDSPAKRQFPLSGICLAEKRNETTRASETPESVTVTT